MQRGSEEEPYAPFTVTLKASDRLDGPWVIVKAETAQQLQERLNSLADVYAFQTISRLSESLSSAFEHRRG